LGVLKPRGFLGRIVKEQFREIYYPDTSVNIYKIVWIDNTTFAAGGYIVELKK
jgi:hypothetical protein